jgi:hypothetical protein
MKKCSISLAIRKMQMKTTLSRSWWCMPIISVLRRLRWEDPKFETSLGYKASSRPACSTKRDPVVKTQSKSNQIKPKQ